MDLSTPETEMLMDTRYQTKLLQMDAAEGSLQEAVPEFSTFLTISFCSFKKPGVKITVIKSARMMKHSKPVKTKRMSMEESKDKENSNEAEDGSKESPREEKKTSKKRRWGSTKSREKQKSSVNISTDILKEIMPEIKQVPLDSVTMEDEDDQPGSDNEDKPDSPAPQTITMDTRIITQVSQEEREETEKGAESSSGEEEGEASDKEEGEADGDKDDEKEDKQDEDEEESKKKDTPVKKKAPRIQAPSSDEPPKKRPARITAPIITAPIDEPVRVEDKIPPAHRPKNQYVHVRHLVRPYTLNQLKELLGRYGTIMEEDGFWIDNIKSHCVVGFTSEDEAEACREGLHGTKWPSSNPKNLSVEYASKNEFDMFNGPKVVKKPEPVREVREERPRQKRDPERDREIDERIKQRAKERALKREREKPAEREWDKGKRHTPERTPSRERKRRERERERREREEKAKEEAEEPPAKLLDDLFKKTKSTPCIYWLPLTEEQANTRIREYEKKRKERIERIQKREEENKKQEEAERKKREEEIAKRRAARAQRSRSRSRNRRRSRSRSRSRGRRR